MRTYSNFVQAESGNMIQVPVGGSESFDRDILYLEHLMKDIILSNDRRGNLRSRMAPKKTGNLSRSDFKDKEIDLAETELLPPMSGKQKVGKSDRYKTEMCRSFSENGMCRYGDKCQFAHGMSELRTVSRHPKYKTDLCKTFHSTGFCPYGARCHFIHSESAQKSGLNSELLNVENSFGWNRANLGSANEKRISPLHDNLDANENVLSTSVVPNLNLSSVNHFHQAGMDAHPLRQQPFTFSTPNFPSPLERWPMLYQSDLMGSTAASPSLSSTDSPVPSPTSMLMLDGDLLVSLANLLARNN